MLRQPSAPQPLVGSRSSGATPTVDPSMPFDFNQAPPPPQPTPNPNMQMFGFPGPYTQAMPARGRNRLFLVIGLSILALGAGFALVILLAGKKPAAKQPAASPAGTGSGSAHAGSSAAPAPNGSASGSAQAIAPQHDAGSAEAPPPKPTTCKVAVTSVPTAADIYIGKKQVGTAPADIEVPCDVATTLELRKAKFSPTDRDVTATAGKDNKVLVKLSKPTVSVKVTSVPAGATITVGGKSMGVTPAKITLPMMEPATVVLSKPGYTNDVTKLVPKNNNAAVHGTLKKKR
jgi:hypothetical protein